MKERELVMRLTKVAEDAASRLSLFNFNPNHVIIACFAEERLHHLSESGWEAIDELQFRLQSVQQVCSEALKEIESVKNSLKEA